MKPFDFWFSIGSTYTYLTVTRLAQVQRETGAESAATEQANQAATSEARALDIFGSPSFVVDGHALFWGDDRLEDAVSYYLRSHLGA